MSDKRVWLISQRGEVIAAFTDGDEAVKEMEYLIFHGEGYTMKWLPLEEKAGGYTNNNGCTMPGAGGVHSDSYFDQGSCKWCGEQGAQR